MRRGVNVWPVAVTWALCAALLSLRATSINVDSPRYPGTSWTVAAAERSKWSVEKLQIARDYSRSIDSSSVMIIQHGRVIAQWGDLHRKISSYSIRKSLVPTEELHATVQVQHHSRRPIRGAIQGCKS